MISSIGFSQNNAIVLLQKHRAKIQEQLKTGNAEDAIITGGNAFTETVWERMLEQVDSYLDEVKKEQEVHFAKKDEENAEKELLIERIDKKASEEELSVKKLLNERAGMDSNVPYYYLAKDGVITYNGVTFVCDEERRAICLGDMTNPDDVINIPLSEGGCLKVNRDNIEDLSKAISMFSPEDIRRIMEAIAQDAKCQQMQQEMDETINSITGNTTIVSESRESDVVTAEQIAALFLERE